MQAEREWAKLKKKYRKLPEWTWLNKNFRIKTEDEPTAGRPSAVGLCEAVRLGVMDKLDHVAHDMIEPIIGGSENYCCYFERRMLGGTERDHLFELYRQLMALLWTGNRLAVDFSEKGLAEWLVDVHSVWERLKPELTAAFDKLAGGWTKYKKSEAETSYHG